MRLYQVITGSCNNKGSCIAFTYFVGTSLVVYGSGSDLIILNKDLVRIQVLQNVVASNKEIVCVALETFNGRIAATDGQAIAVYEAQAPVNNNAVDRLSWVRTALIPVKEQDKVKGAVSALAWLPPATLAAAPVLVAGTTCGRLIALEAPLHLVPTNSTCVHSGSEDTPWIWVWSVQAAGPVEHLEFSPDGRFLASLTQQSSRVSDSTNLINIWTPTAIPRRPGPPPVPSLPATPAGSDRPQPLQDLFLHLEWHCLPLFHPNDVLAFSWRRFTAYVPPGWLPNALLTSCADGVARVWIESIAVEDRYAWAQPGNIDTFNGAEVADGTQQGAIPTLPDILMRHPVLRHYLKVWLCHPFNDSELRLNSTLWQQLYTPAPSFASAKFTLAASVNAADLNLPVPDLPSDFCPQGSSRCVNYTVHWLNNKSLGADEQFACLLTQFIAELANMPIGDPVSEFSTAKFKVEIGVLDQALLKFLNSWRRASDTVFMFHPLDGSLFIWAIDGLDRCTLNASILSRYAYMVSTTTPHSKAMCETALMDGGQRVICQAGVSLRSRIPDVMSRREAISMTPILSSHLFHDSRTVCSRFFIQSASAEGSLPQLLCAFLITRAQLANSLSKCSNAAEVPDSTRNGKNKLLVKLRKIQLACSDGIPSRHPIALTLTCTHIDGAISQWLLSVGNSIDYSGVLSVSRSNHINGHRWPLQLMSGHPLLPLLITSSAFRSTETSSAELLLWFSVSASPLSSDCRQSATDTFLSGNSRDFRQASCQGLRPIARLEINSASAFSSLAWFPCLVSPTFASDHFSPSDLPISLFVSDLGCDQLAVFVGLIDAPPALLSLAELNQKAKCGQRPVINARSSMPGLIMQLNTPLQCRPLGIDESVLMLRVIPRHFVGEWQPRDETDIPSSDEVSSFLVFRLVSVVSGCWTEAWQVDLKPNQQTFLTCQEHPIGCLHPHEDLNAFDKLIVSVKKVIDEPLPLEKGLTVVEAKPDADHICWAPLATTHIPPPFFLLTLCSDFTLRFWSITESTSTSDSSKEFRWSEWETALPELSASRISVPSGLLLANLTRRAAVDALEERSRNLIGSSPSHSWCNPALASILAVACVCNGRVAVACCSYSRESEGSEEEPVQVAIFECESSGGCEWMLEDIVIPRYAGGKMPICKQSIQLDWVNTEDGGYLLSIVSLHQLWIYVPMCHDVFLATRCPTAKNSSTLLTTLGEVGLRWVCLRYVCLNLLDDSNEATTNLAITPKTQMALWLSNGLFLSNRVTELHVFSQWPAEVVAGRKALVTKLSIANAFPFGVMGDLLKAADFSPSSMGAARLKRNYSDFRLASLDVGKDEAEASRGVVLSRCTRSDSSRKPSHSTSYPKNSLDMALLSNLGLFEAVQLVNPVLPQFHPRQLLEWMNIGRLRRVQALLVHLTCCLSAFDLAYNAGNSGRGTPATRRPRFHSMSNPDGFAPGDTVAYAANAEDEMEPNRSYTSNLEIQSIPPLPLYVLLELDSLSLNAGNARSTDTLSDQLSDVDATIPRLDTDTTLSLDDLNEPGDPSPEGGEVSDGETSQWRISLEEMGYLTGGLPSNPMWNPAQGNLVRMLNFGLTEAQILSDLISRYRLPGLSRLDQMYLLGIAELMANTRSDVTERLSGIAVAPKNMAVRSELQSGTASAEVANHDLELDECGLRYLLIMQLYSYLCRTLPPAKRTQLLKSGITSRSFVWAFHSEADEVLLSFLPSQKQGSSEILLTWAEFKRYGCGWWIRSDIVLQNCAQKIARSEFLRTKDPMISAIFYLAMRKNTVLASLFKSQGNRQLEQFFRSDFTPGQPACRQAKLNAFRLMSQHKFQQAAAIFLVGGWLDDAIRVCVDSMNDLQLAVVIARLYSIGQGTSSGTSAYHSLLHNYILPHKDPYLRSIAYWTLGEPLEALKTLLQAPTGCPQSPDGRPSTAFESTISLASSSLEDLPGFEICPSVFKLYTHLRSHPLVTRKLRLLLASAESSASLENHLYRLSVLDRRLYFRTAYHYNAIGCPALALEVLTRLSVGENQADLWGAKRQRLRSLSMAKPSTTFDLSLDPSVVAPMLAERDEKKGEREEESIGMFLTTSVSAQKDEEFKVTWSDEEGEDEKEPVALCSDVDTPPPNSTSPPRTSSLCGHRRKTTTSSQHPLDLEGTYSMKPDSILTQMKFVACIRIFTEELCAFASVVSPGGACLRSKLWLWLEHELNGLRRTTSLKSNCEGESTGTSAIHHCLLSSPPPLYLSEQQPNFVPLVYARDLEGYFTPVQDQPPLQTVAQTVRQRENQLLKDRLLWLKVNMPFIYSLINFCGLQGASGLDLHPVRMELLQLIAELFAASSQSVLPAISSDSSSSFATTTTTAKTSSSSTINQFLNRVPLLRSVFLIPPGVMYLPKQIFMLKSLVNDISSTLATLPPPFQLCVQVPQADDQIWMTVLRSSPHLTENENDEWGACLQKKVLLLRNLCMALSGCMFQSLSTGGWTGETFDGSNAGVAVPASAMNGRSVDRLLRQGLSLKPNTEPCNWPGVSGLQSYLSSSICSNGSTQDNASRSTQCLIGLLAEVLVSVYVGLAVYALYTRDCSTLYRMVLTRLDSAAWSRVFGGIYRVKPVRPVAPPSPHLSPGQPKRPPSSPNPCRLTPAIVATSDRAIQKPPSPKLPSPRPPSTPPVLLRSVSLTPTYPDEWFLPPQCSILSYLLEKPSAEGESASDAAFIYDSDVSSVPADYEDFKAATRRRRRRLHRLRNRVSALALDKSVRVGKDIESSPRPCLPSSGSSSNESYEQFKTTNELIVHPGCDLQMLHLNSDFDSCLSSNPHPSFGPLGLESAFCDLQAFCRESMHVGSGAEDDFGATEDEDLAEEQEGSGVRMAVHFHDVFTDCPVSGGVNFSDGDAQWMHGDSYAWRLIRFTFMHLIGQRITELTRMLNLDCEHLATYAPSVSKILTLIELWKAGYESAMLKPPSHPQQSDVFEGRVCSGGGLLPSANKESRYLVPPPHFIPGADALIRSELEEEVGTMPSSPFGRIGLRRFSLSQNPPPMPEAAKRAINRMRYLLNPKHSPFQTRDPFSLPVKRLWFSLLNQPGLGEIFARYIFRVPKVVRPFLPPLTFAGSNSSGADECLNIEPITLKLPALSGKDRDHVFKRPTEASRVANEMLLSGPSPLQVESSIRLVHKNVEPLLCMCVDRVHYRYIAIGLPKQIIELDITNLLPPATWLMDDLEYDLEAMRNPQLKVYAEGGFDDFILYDKVPEPSDFSDRSSVQDSGVSYGSVGGSSTRRFGSQMVLRRSVPGVQKLSAHPLLPFYLCGTMSGSVHVLEWAASDPIVSTFTNTFALTPQGLAGPLTVGVRGAPVSVLCMDATGKRFGCGDTVGNFGLWNLELNSPNRHPYFNCRAHAKGVLDFTFLNGASTLLATVGAGGSPSAVTSTSSGSAVMVSAPHWSQRHRGSRGSVFRALAPSELEAASVVLWDVLLPRNRAAVMSFSEPPLDAACSCLAHVPNFSLSAATTSLQTPDGSAFISADRLLAIGTRRGEVAFLDLRKPAVLFHLTAHESAVRDILIDKATDTFVTAGADGSVKAWKLSVPRLLATFQTDAQHNRAAASIAAAALFRGNQSAAVVAASKPGISALLLLPTASETTGDDPFAPSLPLFASRFLSCGVDGCLQLCSIIPRPDPIWLSPN
uniref:RAVE complex protein Rav1 C-terminal domain-containing protein n=2 Tax=Schistocephalus solidus TaxID=70667 RepID=A0A0X3Q9N0_SCHSO